MRMEPRIFLVAWLFSCTAGLHAAAAADAERTAVVAVVQRFFDAMSTRHEAGMREVFHPGTQFAWGKPTEGGITVSNQTIEAFAVRAAGAKERYLERMWNPTVHVDGRIAVVWARYDFHVGEKFSHNGIDCFTLLKSDQGWKIVSLVFSVEPGPRTEHPAGPPTKS